MLGELGVLLRQVVLIGVDHPRGELQTTPVNGLDDAVEVAVVRHLPTDPGSNPRLPEAGQIRSEVHGAVLAEVNRVPRVVRQEILGAMVAGRQQDLVARRQVCDAIQRHLQPHVSEVTRVGVD